MMEWIDYFNILILVHLCLQLFFGLFLLYKTFRILRIMQISTKASPTMILYFCFLALLGSLLAIYAIYAIANWRLDEILADPKILYILGFLPWILICINSAAEFCLCLERIFIVSFPDRYLDRSKKCLASITFFMLIFCLSLNIFLNDLKKIPQLPAPNICRFFTCFTTYMSKPFLLPYKIIISTLEGAAAISLLLLIKYRTNPAIYAKSKSRNNAMLIIIFTTLIFEFTPNLIDQIISSIFDGFSLVIYIGPYRTTISCISITINILMYSRVFNKNRKNANSIHVIPAITSQTKKLTNSIFKSSSN